MSSYEAALKSVETKTGRKRTKVGTDGQPVTTGERKPKRAAATKAKASTKGKPVARLTNKWPDAKGKDVPMKATVKFDGKQWTVKSRFTSRTKDGALVPSLALATKSGEGEGKHTPAKTVTLA
jgi:hypothetical protein